ncbi:MAG TPA: ABC transporter transmembrane domain-containing protein, partial [Bryobacteraceae bacterium]|nr:ABC transporter transmembrane domain-containing protein [Bryobacteraceae bacterium]
MWESLRTVRVYLWRYRRGMALGLGALVLKDLAGAAQPLAIRAAVDALSHASGLAKLLRYAGYLIGLAMAKGLFQYWMRVIIIGISRDIEYDLRNDLFRHLVELAPDYYGRVRTGDIMARATNDLNAVRMMLGPGIMYWTETSLTFLLAIIIMVTVDWRLALLAVLPAPLVSLAVIFFGRAIHARFERIQAMFSDISSRVQENLAGVRMVRAFAQEQAEMRRFEELNRAYIAENIRLVRISGVFQPLLEALIGLTFLAVLWYGGAQVLSGRISLGSFVMFNTYMGILVWPMIALGWVVNLMQRGGASLERINQIFREQPAIAAPPHPVALTRVRGEIEFRNASMEYPSGRALDGVDLCIEAGTTVAVVGHTGSGKSTLVSLVPRLFDPTEGTVAIDGIDLRDADPAGIRRQIGFVPQETFLFSATIAGNIAFGVEQATDEEIRRAAEIAGLSSDIEGFPNGYQTIVGER